MYRIFLVEDDLPLAEAMTEQLSRWGNEVIPAKAFADLIPEFLACQPHLVLLDIKLPYYDGYHWCREIRRVSGVPIVFISSASDDMSLVMAINQGGDDFIAKPVDPSVLCAKVGAVLRRVYELPGISPILTFRGAVLDLGSGVLTLGERRLELTKNEFRILETLLENKGRTVSREQLMLRLWQNDCYVEENTLSVNVARLRRKLDEFGIADAIVTKTGSGYRIDE